MYEDESNQLSVSNHYLNEKRSPPSLIYILHYNPSFSNIPLKGSVSHTNPVQEVVYVTKTESKYHKGACHYLKKSKIKTSKSDAKSAGFSACSVCKPG